MRLACVPVVRCNIVLPCLVVVIWRYGNEVILLEESVRKSLPVTARETELIREYVLQPGGYSELINERMLVIVPSPIDASLHLNLSVLRFLSEYPVHNACPPLFDNAKV